LSSSCFPLKLPSRWLESMTKTPSYVKQSKRLQEKGEFDLFLSGIILYITFLFYNTDMAFTINL
jgi:hypothetical protein